MCGCVNVCMCPCVHAFDPVQKGLVLMQKGLVLMQKGLVLVQTVKNT